MNKIFHDLYFGRLAPSERSKPQNPKFTLIDDKIDELTAHFKDTLSPEDWEQFEKLDSMYMELLDFFQVDAYAYGLSMGISLMTGVLDFDLLEKYYTKNNAAS